MEKTDQFLDELKVLDLTDEKGFLCGKILGDLGAEVIKVEPPGGSSSRNIPPYYKDIVHPEKSLFWFAYNANKRGITLNIQTTDGRNIFKKLASTADMILETFPVGYMSEIGLGYQEMAEINPKIIMVSISPFGQTGPYKNYKATDIISAAMGGLMYVTGEPDGQPLRIGFPQSYMHAGATASVSALIAFYHTLATGKGQYIDVSMSECMLPVSGNVSTFWYLLRENLKREGIFRAGTAGNAIIRLLWPCKDGYVSYAIMGTPSGTKSNVKLISLMERTGMANPLKSFDFDGFDRRTATQETQSLLENAVAPFFLKYTKKELLGMAIENGIMLLPVYSPAELVEYPQLQEREFWTKVDHPELNKSLIYPGPFIKSTSADCGIKRRAPLIGEHNHEVFVNELGFTQTQLIAMKEAGII